MSEVGRMSLMHGWIPGTVQIVTVLVLLRAIGWHSPRWHRWRLPVAVTFGTVTTLVAHWFFGTLGMAGEPAPWQLWAWVALSALAAATVVTGWVGSRWSRRNLTVFAMSLCLASTGLTINSWIGYVPTVYTAWNQLTSGPLPDETDWATVRALQRRGVMPTAGKLLRVTIDADDSGFEHRDEFVYLPPVWFTSNPPPPLPSVMMIGGQFNTPADWVRAGDAVRTLDEYAADHSGVAPVAVFVDSAGAFTNDTECVNGPRGNAADHLTRDVVPYLVANFGVSADQSHRGVVGFSSGGTCAVDLAVMHPRLFRAFVDIAGDLGPNVGTREQTIDRLFGGSAEAWSTFDPSTVMTRHGAYTNLAGLFVVPDGGGSSSYGVAADALCALGTANGVTCGVVPMSGGHVWPFAGVAFAKTLPWLANELDVAGGS